MLFPQTMHLLFSIGRCFMMRYCYLYMIGRMFSVLEIQLIVRSFQILKVVAFSVEETLSNHVEASVEPKVLSRLCNPMSVKQPQDSLKQVQKPHTSSPLLSSTLSSSKVVASSFSKGQQPTQDDEVYLPLPASFRTTSTPTEIWSPRCSNLLASQQFIDFFFKWKLDTGLLTKLQTTLQVIYAVLDDAEEKQAENDPHVKNWLDKVRDAAYDAEDILEEIAIDALESRNKVPNFIYESLNLSQEVKEGIDFKKKDIAAALNPFGERIDSKMRNIVERLEDIVKQKDILRLRENTRGIVSGIEKRLTTPLVNEEHVFGSPIYGRDGDKEEMIKLLTSCEENSDEIRGLSSDDCWSLLEQIAFPNGNSYAFPELKVIAEGVARKCKGLPLAAKSLGGLLRSNPNENYWKDILNSKIWDFSNNGIIPPLRLSYHHLPPHLKQCFVYCAVFPKDFEFDIEMLVLLWIAEGFVQQPEGGKEMEAMARSYFFDLLSRSFFQQSSVDKSQYLMHDLIHDLAQFISGKEFLSQQALSTLLLKCRHLIKLPMDLKNVTNLRHLNIETSGLQLMPVDMGKLTSLQTLSNFVVGKGRGSGIGQLKSLSNLRGKLSISGLQNVVNVRDAIEAKLEDKEYLEKLVLEWIGIFDGTRDEKVENEILDMLQPHENLKNLSIEYYGGTEFPSWVGDPSFSKMEYLNLKGCKKCISLPSLGQLPLLKELIIEGMDGIKHVGPQFYGDDYSSIDPFQSLETLKFENIEEWEEWSSFGDGGVEGFPCLRELSIFKCPKLTSKLPNYLPSLEGVWIDDCEKLAVLPKLVKLLNLDLLGSNVEILGTMVDLRSLTFLQINQISTLKIFPEGFMQQSAKLEELKIVNCGDLVALSNQQLGLAHLASLRRLTISGCPKLVALPDEVNKMPPRLESLDIKDCHNLEKLPDELFKLESLSELRVEGCQKLESFPDMGLPSKLKRLVIQNCGAMKAIQDGNLRSNTSLEFLEIRSCSSLVSVLEGGIPTTLKYMRISYCKSLKSLPVEMMNNDMSLEYLEIEACASLLSFPVGELPKSLKRLEISICGNFLSLPSSLLNLVHLDFLHLENCPLLEYFPNTGLPTPNLRKLTIATCKKLKFLPNRFHNLKSLQKLALSRCPSLVSLPKQGLPTNLISLEITRCEKLNPIDEWKLHKLTTLRTFLFEGIPGLVSFSNTYLLPDSITFLHIQELPDLLSISEGLQNLTSLETLKIRDCHKLQALPKEGLPATLSSLTIKNCPLIQSRCKQDTGEDWSKIMDIPNVDLF
ncbi:unnamed protein product, partial [Vitis vinifera]